MSYGLIDRWPDGGGNLTTHDELIGAVYFSILSANDILKDVRITFGFYNNTKTFYWKAWIYRFVWVIAYTRKRAGWSLMPWHRLGFALYLIMQAISHDDNTHKGQDGLLMSWLMRDEMRNVFGCRLAWKFWEYRMRNIGPKWCFERYLGPDYPVYYECAPERFK